MKVGIEKGSTNVTVNECYELEGDYQNQFLGSQITPKPKYQKLKLSERSFHKVHYDDIYILEPLHYYYVSFNENISLLRGFSMINVEKILSENGLMHEVDWKNNRMYLFNASQNIVYLQKGTLVAKVISNG